MNSPASFGTRARGFVRSNLLGFVAIFIALSATAIAAVHLPKGSVGTKQLKNNAVVGSKVADGSLTGADINSSTLGKVSGAGHADDADKLGGIDAARFGGVLTDNSPAFSNLASQAYIAVPVTGDEAPASSTPLHPIPNIPMDVRDIAIHVPPLNGASGPFAVSLEVTPANRIGSTLVPICTLTFPQQGCTADGPIAVPAGGYLRWQIQNTGSNASTAAFIDSSLLLTPA